MREWVEDLSCAHKTETLMCVAVGTASRQRSLQNCAVYGRCGSVLKNYKTVRKLSELN